MNYEWIEKILLKKSNPKNWKKTKNQSENAACEQKNHQWESEVLFKHRFRTLL